MKDEKYINSLKSAYKFYSSPEDWHKRREIKEKLEKLEKLNRYNKFEIMDI